MRMVHSIAASAFPNRPSGGSVAVLGQKDIPLHVVLILGPVK